MHLLTNKSRRLAAPNGGSPTTLTFHLATGCARKLLAAAPTLNLECTASPLFSFNGFKQGLEVALAESAGAVPLNHLKEQCRTILGRLGEDLQQIALVIPVHEDTERSQVADVLVDITDAIGEHIVI